eukprot:gnl/Chilomastix_caulleri/2859.p1 GENE.gnl/Chilomastix_caulleri/2859~~gnl/Chilomastix_caulleri/2859.p1  ORF type:complete len:99 (+),score=28.36 gnl/Chilomastix_caulleri/2859:270-566(+)
MLNSKRDITSLHAYIMAGVPRMIKDVTLLKKCCSKLVVCETKVLSPELMARRIGALLGRILSCLPLSSLYSTRHLISIVVDTLKLAPKSLKEIREEDN